MAKELPYFRFEPSEWDNGNIQMCSRESKGMFIDLCSIYWSRLGELPYALALQKLCNGNKDALQELINHEIFSIIDDQIVIGFLDEQLLERGQVSVKRREAAQKRWSDASALQLESKSNANRREENIKEEKKIVAIATLEKRSEKFYETLVPYVEKYSKDMIRNFYDYWVEPNKNKTKLRFEGQKFFDVSRRLATWNGRDNNSSASKEVKNRFKYQ